IYIPDLIAIRPVLRNCLILGKLYVFRWALGRVEFCVVFVELSTLCSLLRSPIDAVCAEAQRIVPVPLPPAFRLPPLAVALPLLYRCRCRCLPLLCHCLPLLF